MLQSGKMVLPKGRAWGTGCHSPEMALGGMGYLPPLSTVALSCPVCCISLNILLKAKGPLYSFWSKYFFEHLLSAWFGDIKIGLTWCLSQENHAHPVITKEVQALYHYFCKPLSNILNFSCVISLL